MSKSIQLEIKDICKRYWRFGIIVGILNGVWIGLLIGLVILKVL